METIHHVVNGSAGSKSHDVDAFVTSLPLVTVLPGKSHTAFVVALEVVMPPFALYFMVLGILASNPQTGEICYVKILNGRSQNETC